MRLIQRFCKPFLALPEVRGSGIIRTIGKPKRNVTAAKALGDLDAVFRVLQCPSANRLIRICERSVFVFLTLEQIGVDGSWRNSIATGKALDVIGVLHALRAIP